MPISLHAPFNREISLSTLNPLRRLASVEKGLAAIQAAGVAGVDTIVFHPADDVRNIPLRGEHAAALIDSMRRLCAAAEAKSIRVALENMPSGELGASLIEIADLVRASGIHNLGVCLDTGHANMNKDLIAGVVASSQRLFALHVHDNDGLKDQHLAVFAGTVNWDEFVKTLRDIRFSGCFMLETGQIFPTKEIPKPPLVWIERVRQLLAERPEG
jgi:sugar phosphate isomerase/epimerase